MDRAGGYLAYLALCEDTRAYEDVVVVLNGEADARTILAQEAKAK